jgi:hypothetical protein
VVVTADFLNRRVWAQHIAKRYPTPRIGRSLREAVMDDDTFPHIGAQPEASKIIFEGINAVRPSCGAIGFGGTAWLATGPFSFGTRTAQLALRATVRLQWSKSDPALALPLTFPGYESTSTHRWINTEILRRRKDEVAMRIGSFMFFYRLFSHDGLGNFSLLHEFKAHDDEAAAVLANRWDSRPVELWQSSRRVKRWE